MKKFTAALCIFGSAIALSACSTEGTGYVDTQPPYATERTASHDRNVVAAPAPAADKVFTRAQHK